MPAIGQTLKTPTERWAYQKMAIMAINESPLTPFPCGVQGRGGIR
jgi:hypothetical protein